MADSGALRQQRHKQHANGDHSLCRAGCPERKPTIPRITALAGDFGGDLDPAASLRALARRLEAAHEEDPSNAMVARELRATLLVLGSGSGKPAPDIVDAIRASWENGG